MIHILTEGKKIQPKRLQKFCFPIYHNQDKAVTMENWYYLNTTKKVYDAHYYKNNNKKQTYLRMLVGFFLSK